MGGLICCCWRMFCCECSICEPRDDWLITSEAKAGERGAGFLYKRAKNSAVWSKRYCTLSDTKLTYYMERDRMVMKGEIVLAGATASMSASRANTKKKFYFNIAHPQCGVREMYAKTKKRRLQWMEMINDISTQLSTSAMYGKLYKQGGMRHNTWQERWCICSGGSLDYFEQATDNQAKGSIDLFNATVKEMDVKGKFCFEIVPAPNGYSKKGKSKDKSYVFHVEKEHDRERWIESIRRAAMYRVNQTVELGENGEPIPGAQNSNPLHEQAGGAGGAGSRSESVASEGDEGEDGEGGGGSNGVRNMSSSVFRMSQMTPTDKEGYLLKKSPALLKGWQKRYFITNSSTGDIDYYKSEEDAHNDKVEPQGTIKLHEIKIDCGLEVDDTTHEVTINTANKAIHLKAGTHAEAVAWVTNITAWMDSTSGQV